MDTGFHNTPRIYPIQHNMFEIHEDLSYHWVINGVEQLLVIEATEEKPYIWDGASIPPGATLLTAILPFFETIYPMGIHCYATAFHDFTFRYQGRLPVGSHLVKKDEEWVPANKRWSFTECNQLFARQLREDGVGRRERRAMFLSVQSPIGYYNWKKGKIPADALPV